MQFSLTHNHITQEALRPQEDPLADYLSLPIHVIAKSFLNREKSILAHNISLLTEYQLCKLSQPTFNLRLQRSAITVVKMGDG